MSGKIIHLPSQRTASEQPRAEMTFDDYREVVSHLFAEHQRVGLQDGPVFCTCGQYWPCRSERLAAQLLDWV